MTERKMFVDLDEHERVEAAMTKEQPMLSDDDLQLKATIDADIAEGKALTAAFLAAAPVDIDALEARTAKMTPGPWRECRANDGRCPCGLVWSLSVDESVGVARNAATFGVKCNPEHDEGCSANNSDDAIGIAAMRNAWPAMVAELRAARDRIAALEAEVAELRAPVTDMRLCEQGRVGLRPGQIYRFTAAPGCDACADAAAPFTRTGEPVQSEPAADGMIREIRAALEARTPGRWQLAKDTVYVPFSDPQISPDFLRYAEEERAADLAKHRAAWDAMDDEQRAHSVAAGYSRDVATRSSVDWYGGDLVCESIRPSDAALVASAPVWLERLLARIAELEETIRDCASECQAVSEELHHAEVRLLRVARLCDADTRTEPSAAINAIRAIVSEVSP